MGRERTDCSIPLEQLAPVSAAFGFLGTVTTVWQEHPPTLHFQKGCSTNSGADTPNHHRDLVLTTVQATRWSANPTTSWWNLVPLFKAWLTILQQLRIQDKKPWSPGSSSALPPSVSIESLSIPHQDVKGMTTAITTGSGILRVYDSYTDLPAQLCLGNASDNLSPLGAFHWQKQRRTRAWEKEGRRKKGGGQKEGRGRKTRKEERDRGAGRSYWTISTHPHPRPQPLSRVSTKVPLPSEDSDKTPRNPVCTK